MNSKMIAGIALIALGIIALAYQGISYTSREKAVDLGPLQITTERERTLPLPPIVGAVALVGGVVLLAMNARKG